MGKIAAAAHRSGVSLERLRQGGHEVWRCGDRVFPVPRHREINEYTARGIMRGLEPSLGKEWWRA
jgi:mRNA interferase HicA